VRAIGKLAIKIEPAAQDCIDSLLELVSTKVSYIVQEATVVIRNIFRKYPNRYESIISILCENLDHLDEPEAKAAMIWVIGEYADRIDNSDVLLDDFLYPFHDEPVEVQLALLTATVKLFIQRPTKGQELVPKVLKWATEETDNPDLRDRGYMYWRLLSTDPETAKKVVMGPKPAITAESEKLDPATLEEMCLNVGTLATVYLKPVQQVFRNARTRKLMDSPALQKHTLPTVIAMEAHKNLPSVINGQGREADQQNGTGSNKANLSAAIDAADLYFQSLSTKMGNMEIGDEGFGGSPTAGTRHETQYVVNQNNGGNGDLLLL
jgi:AP-2 complex subunit beta-1